MTANDDRFDLAKSRVYWRHAPSGEGKHDTAALLELDDHALEQIWNNAFAKRFAQYPEEDVFLRRMASEFAGKRVLSIGSGLGLHEIYYQLHGARMTCCDIVASNLDVIRRVAAIKGAQGIETLVSRGADQDLGGPFDVVFIYGSLMTMPEPLQRELLARAMAALVAGGRIVLMLYTWEFARGTCGWSSRDEFDPVAFARASDPSVGAEHCPWSDWHDDAKLEALVDGKMHVRRRQLWNQDWFSWHELSSERTDDPEPFFAQEELLAVRVVREFPLDAFHLAEAEVASRDGALAVATKPNNFAYALVTEPLSGSAADGAANALLVDAELHDGGFSVGLLDEEKNAFTAAAPVWQPGRMRHVIAVARMPRQFRIVVSNHRPGAPAASRFDLFRVALLERETAARQVGIEAPAPEATP